MATTNLNKREKALLLFYLKGTLSDLSKALIFFILFFLLGFHREFAWGLFFFVSFRVYSGGIHCKTYFLCLVLSLLLLSSGIFLGSLLFLPKPVSTCCSMLCGIITCILSPIQAPTRPTPSKDFIRTVKIKEAIIICIFVVAHISTTTNKPVNIGFWLLVIHTIQLYIAYKKEVKSCHFGHSY